MNNHLDNNYCRIRRSITPLGSYRLPADPFISFSIPAGLSNEFVDNDEYVSVWVRKYVSD